MIDDAKANFPQIDKTIEIQDKLKHVHLADPNFDHNSVISIIVSAYLFGLTLSDHTLHIGADLTTVIKTIINNYIMGTILISNYQSNTISMLRTS